MKFYNESKGDLLSDAKITGSVTLGTNCHKPTVGRPVSGKNWKKEGERAGMNKVQFKKTWDKKMEAKKELKVI